MKYALFSTSIFLSDTPMKRGCSRYARIVVKPVSASENAAYNKERSIESKRLTSMLVLR